MNIFSHARTLFGLSNKYALNALSSRSAANFLALDGAILTNNASISNLFPGYFVSRADQAASSIPKADNGHWRL